jgi:hypothetical protein
LALDAPQLSRAGPVSISVRAESLQDCSETLVSRRAVVVEAGGYPHYTQLIE